MKVKEINVNGTPYLAKIDNAGGNVTLFDAMVLPGTGARQCDFTAYLQAKNLNELTTVEFAGRGVTYSIIPLSDAQKLTFEVVKLNMQRAKSVAVSELENRKLAHLLGKQ